MKNQAEQHITKGIKETIDNYALQKILFMIDGAKVKKDELIKIKLGKCPHCSKQRISLENDEAGECFFCEKPVDQVVIVYQLEENKQLICLESEAEELVEQQVEEIE